MIRKLVAGAVDKALDALWPLEIRCNNYLSALNGVTPPFEHDSVQQAENTLADLEAERDSWEPDELWAAQHMQDGDLDCLCTTPQRQLNTYDSDTVFDTLADHMYIATLGHCLCQYENRPDADDLGIAKWNDHVSDLIVEALNKGKK